MGFYIEAPDTSFVADRLKSETVANISAAVIKEVPYHYSIVDKFVPDDFAKRLLEDLPSSSSLKTLKDRRGAKVDPDYSDQRFYLECNTDDEVLEFQGHPVFREAIGILASQEVHRAIIRRFSSPLQAVLTEYEIAIARPDVEFILDRTGYSLKPHTDAPDKLITILVYLGRQPAGVDTADGLGTSIYKFRDTRSVSLGNVAMPREYLTEVERAPYRPNAGVMFARTDYSFHGVEEVAPGLERVLFQVSLILRKIKRRSA